MPIYEFKCENCGHQFESLVFLSDTTDPTCPECHTGKVTKLMSAGSVRPKGIPSGSGGFKAPACSPGG